MKTALPFIITLLSLLVSCKKDASIKQNDVVGQYYLAEWNDFDLDGKVIHKANSAEMTCMRNFKFSLNASHSVKSVYLGAGICYLYYDSMQSNTSISGNDSPYTWEYINGEVLVKSADNLQVEHYKVVKRNGKIGLELNYNKGIHTKSVLMKE